MMGIAAGLYVHLGKYHMQVHLQSLQQAEHMSKLRNSIAYPKLNVKICATHAGITVGEDGATHQMIEDLGA